MKIRLATAALLLAFAATAPAVNWPQWRGPDQNGVSPAKNVPDFWAPGENMAWKVKMPNRSGSTPAVWGDRIFITSVRDGKNTVQCLDASGKERWSAQVGPARDAKHKMKGSGSHPSPVTDGKHVWVYFKSGDVACFDAQGKQKWSKNILKEHGEDNLWWDLGTSPVLSKKLLIIATQQEKPAYVVGLDKETGKKVWKQDRNLPAPIEANHSYTTPLVYEFDDRERFLVLGADHVTAHDAATGKELWRVGGLNPTKNGYFRSIAGPVVSDGVVLAPYARGGSLTAIKLGGSGDVTKTHVLWSKEGISADVPTPAAVNGRAYVCSDKGELSCLDVKTGKVHWTERLAKHRAKYSASPIIAAGKVVVTREDGTTFFVKDARTYQLLGEASIGEFTLATPVITDGQVLIRGAEHLFCIRK